MRLLGVKSALAFGEFVHEPSLRAVRGRRQVSAAGAGRAAPASIPKPVSAVQQALQGGGAQAAAFSGKAVQKV